MVTKSLLQAKRTRRGGIGTIFLQVGCSGWSLGCESQISLTLVQFREEEEEGSTSQDPGDKSRAFLSFYGWTCPASLRKEESKKCSVFILCL